MDIDFPFDSPQKPVVLIVDDDLDNLILLTHQVSLLVDCALVTASDGHTACAIAAGSPLDLILLDMMLPEMSGLEFMRWLQNTPALRDIPVIGVSALAHPSDRERALQAGCVDYVCKPYDLDHLEAAIQRALRRTPQPVCRGCPDEGSPARRTQFSASAPPDQWRPLL